HAGDELAEQLAGIAGDDLGPATAAVERALQPLGESAGDADAMGRDAQPVAQPLELKAVLSQRRLPAAAQRLPRDRGGHVGIAVAIAADPGAESENRRNPKPGLGVVPRQR